MKPQFAQGDIVWWFENGMAMKGKIFKLYPLPTGNYYTASNNKGGLSEDELFKSEAEVAPRTRNQ